MSSLFTRPLMLGLGLALLSSPAGAQVANALRPGDAIRINGSAEEQLSGTFAIDEGGRIVLPLLGERVVTDVGASEVKQVLQRDYLARLGEFNAVEITPLRRVRVLGAIKNPGIYHVDATMAVGDVIALAGGATREGDADDVRILRAGDEIRIGTRLSQSGAQPVWSGDEIVIPERSWLARNAAVVVGGTISAAAIIVSRVLE